MEMVKTVSVLGSSLEQLNNKLNCTDVIETFNVPGELLLFFFVEMGNCSYSNNLYAPQTMQKYRRLAKQIREKEHAGDEKKIQHKQIIIYIHAYTKTNYEKKIINDLN